MRKVAIVGKGPTAVLAPFFDETWEIWGLAWVKYPREDKTFDIHEPGLLIEEKYPEVLAIGRAKEIPVIGFENGVWSRNVPYPFEEIFEHFGQIYFESSIAYMMALAIYEKVDVIGLWGVHMATDTEYFEQRANCDYWVGYARGRGIEVQICPGAPICMSNWEGGRYGLLNSKRR